MTALAWALLAGAAVAAVTDWWAVWGDHPGWRPLTKSAAMALLLILALAVGPPFPPVDGRVRVAVVIAVGASLLGDVLLLPQVDGFEAGLAAFLLAHVAYAVAFGFVGLRRGWVVLGVALLVPFVATVGRRILFTVAAEEPSLSIPVRAYLAVICAMSALAVGTAHLATGLGAVVFVASDAQLAWDRFVRPDRRLALGVIVTYHLAQALLVLSLLTLHG